jgi:lipid-A-disaccharide synthase
MEPISGPGCVMIIAGEASGDLHGSKLVREMLKIDRDLFFFGIGGNALKQVGVRILVNASELSVVGITEVFSKISNICKAMSLAKRILNSLRPDLLILIDFPDFNLHLAAAAKKLAIPVLYYISPQIWAWRTGRVKKIGKRVDHMAVILPFEEAFYRNHNVPVTFVGHPLLETDLLLKNPIYQKKADPVPVIGLLPGSRDGEVSRHLPIMFEAARILSRRLGDVKFLISLAPSIEKNYAKAIIEQMPAALKFELATSDVRHVFERARIVVAASGTVTLEAAIYGIPMVIIYKVSQLSYWLGRTMIKIKNIGLVNLIAGKEIVPELVQNDASPENIAEQVERMLNDPVGLERMRNELLRIRNSLGRAGASGRTADIAILMLKNKKE